MEYGNHTMTRMSFQRSISPGIWYSSGFKFEYYSMNSDVCETCESSHRVIAFYILTWLLNIQLYIVEIKSTFVNNMQIGK